MAPAPSPPAPSGSFLGPQGSAWACSLRVGRLRCAPCVAGRQSGGSQSTGGGPTFLSCGTSPPPHHAAAMRCRSLLGSQVHVPSLVSARFSSLTSGITFRGEPPALLGLHLCPPRPGATSTHRSAVVFTGVDTESAAGPQGGADLGADSGFYCY